VQAAAPLRPLRAAADAEAGGECARGYVHNTLGVPSV
jgi:hypothetical protein